MLSLITQAMFGNFLRKFKSNYLMEFVILIDCTMTMSHACHICLYYLHIICIMYSYVHTTACTTYCTVHTYLVVPVPGINTN